MEADILQYIQHHPNMAYLAVYGVLLACGLGVPMPEDVTLVAGGYTVYLAQLNKLSSPTLPLMITVGLIGVLTGDVILFMLGRWLGPRATKIWPFRRLFSPHRLERTRTFFHRYGGWTAFFARFAAGLRAPTYLLAGSMGMRFRTFIVADGLAALISVPLLVWLAWKFGAEIDRVKVWLANSKYAVGAVFLILAIYIIYKIVKKRRAKRAAEADSANDAANADDAASADDADGEDSSRSDGDL